MKCSYVVYKYTKHENVNCHCKLGHIELLECLHYSKYHMIIIFYCGLRFILLGIPCKYIFMRLNISKELETFSRENLS